MNEVKNEIKKIDDDFIMLPTVDYVFKLLFGDVNHKERLVSLISSIIKIPIEKFKGIEILNTELPRLFDEDKKGILDIRAKMSDGKQIDIEIQVLPMRYMPERTLYYWSKMYTMQTKKGDTYKNLKKCITINIVDYEFLPVKKMHTCFHLREDDTGHKLTDVIEVHFCELQKLRNGKEVCDLNDPSINWLKFIGSKTKGEMEMVANNSDMIKDTFDYLQVISKDEQKRLAYEARQMFLMDQKTREEEVKDEAKLEIAKNAIKEGADIHFVAKITSLDLETIEKLQKEMKEKNKD